MSYILAIDSGNSNIKWGLYHGDQWLMQGNVFYKDVSNLEDEFINLPTPTFIIISHVARSETRNQITKLISLWPSRLEWLSSNNFRCNVINGYINPSQLGSDRWAALIAAWRIEKQPCLVINAGTAVTIDVLSESGKFLGGIILPGFNLMTKSLLSGTQLTNIELGSYEDFPVSTENALQSGLIHCILGAVDRMYNLLLSTVNLASVNCIISGGSASLLIPFFKLPIKVINNLVLEGLIIVANDTLGNSEPSFSL
ncbi:MAG: type III pantothenate kinase [Nitrosomonas sp.]|uniref:type III pantothenate kinase n=1 Tax=Nitrosomonas sp. TaxID=42353 RepID=UPI0025F670AD|nr:type III pantothenate kinase [Nitrosomonas sp.]MBY0475915.1 type III pantothenate kinase [Nitrosomonas sp.]